MQIKESLLQIIDDPATSDSERREAQRQLETLDPKSPLTDEEQRAVDFCGPLGLDLLRFAGAHELSEVSWRNLVKYTDSCDWPGKWGNPDVKLLWLGWTVWGPGGINPVTDFRQQIWSAIKAEFATDEERRAEFDRIDRKYPFFDLSAIDNPYELETYERHLTSSDRDSMLAIVRKRFDEAPEYAFRTREVAQRIIAKLQGEKMQLELTNDELYRRMKELRGKFNLGANRESQLSAIQTTALYKEVRRRADADKVFEQLIPLELMPLFFPERFKGARP